MAGPVVGRAGAFLARVGKTHISQVLKRNLATMAGVLRNNSVLRYFLL
jgi:hypothetical protein